MPRRLLASTLTVGLLFASACGSEQVSTPGSVTEAETLLKSHKDIGVTVMNLLVRPAGGIEGHEAVYLPLKVAGVLVAASCDDQNRFRLQTVDTPAGSEQFRFDGLTGGNAEPFTGQGQERYSHVQLAEDGCTAEIDGNVGLKVGYIGTPKG